MPCYLLPPINDMTINNLYEVARCVKKEAKTFGILWYSVSIIYIFYLLPATCYTNIDF